MREAFAGILTKSARDGHTKPHMSINDVLGNTYKVIESANEIADELLSFVAGTAIDSAKMSEVSPGLVDFASRIEMSSISLRAKLIELRASIVSRSDG